MPPPSSGGLTMLQMLKMFEDINLTQYDVTSAEKYHHMVEAMHLAYADRGAYIGDPEYVDVPKEGLLHPDYIKHRVDLIDAFQTYSYYQSGYQSYFLVGELVQVTTYYDTISIL